MLHCHEKNSNLKSPKCVDAKVSGRDHDAEPRPEAFDKCHLCYSVVGLQE